MSCRYKASQYVALFSLVGETRWFPDNSSWPSFYSRSSSVAGRWLPLSCCQVTVRSDDGVGRLAGRCRLITHDGCCCRRCLCARRHQRRIEFHRRRVDGGVLVQNERWFVRKTHMPRCTSATGSIRQVDLVRAMRQYARDLCFTPVVFVVSKSHGLADGNRRPMLSRPIIVDSLATFGICQRALSSRRGRRR